MTFCSDTTEPQVGEFCQEGTGVVAHRVGVQRIGYDVTQHNRHDHENDQRLEVEVTEEEEVHWTAWLLLKTTSCIEVGEVARTVKLFYHNLVVLAFERTTGNGVSACGLFALLGG